MFQKVVYQILCCCVIHCYSPTGNYMPETQGRYFNELPSSNRSRDIHYTSPSEPYDNYENGIIIPLGVSREGLVYTPNNTDSVQRYDFNSSQALNEESLSEIVTLLKKLNSSIYEGVDGVASINQCFEKISKVDQCHIQITCGVLLLYLNNLKKVKNEIIAVFAVDYFNNFLNESDAQMASFYSDFKKFIDRRAFDASGSLIENHFFIDNSFKNDLQALLLKYRMLFSSINSSSLFNFSYKENCLRCNQPFSKNNVNQCKCPINEQKSGFNYNKNEKTLCEYSINNGNFVNTPLQNRAYKFLGYGFDVFGNVFVAAVEEGLDCFIPVGVVPSGCKIIISNNQLFFVNNEMDYFAYRAIHNLENSNTSEKIVDYNLLSNRLKLLVHNNLIFVFMICAPLIAIMFFVLFCVNWAGHCHNCGNPAVKFLGGLFNFFVGMEIGLLSGEFIFNFKKLITEDSVVRYSASIKNNFCTIRKIIRSKMAGNLTFNNFFVILGSVVAGLLAVWPLIWFIVIEALDKRLVNGVSFIAGISLLISGFGFGSVAYYCNRYKEVKNILEYDSLS